MSLPDSTDAPGGIYEEKPRSNIYTAMLGVAFVALAFASTMMALELKEYDFQFKPADVPPNPVVVGK